MDRACCRADRTGVVGDGSQVPLRPQPSVVQLLRRHRSSLLGGWCDRPLELAAPRKNKGPGGWSRPGLWFTRDRRGSGRHSDERDATEVTGGHPGLGTTTQRRQLHSHARGLCRSRQRVSSATASPGQRFTARDPCGQLTRRAPTPPCSAPPPHLRSRRGLRARGPQAGRRGSPASRLAALGAHHDGRPPPARRGSRGLAAHAAAGRRGGRAQDFPGPRLPLMSQDRRRAVRRSGQRRTGSGAHRHGRPPSARRTSWSRSSTRTPCWSTGRAT